MTLVPFAALLPFFSTLAGGIAALRLRHRLHPFMALAAGVLLATAVAELLPEAYGLVGTSATLEVGVATVVGFLAFTLIEAFIHLGSFEHTHPSGLPLDGAHTHPSAGGSGLLRVLPPASLIAHSLLDGLAIGLGFQAEANLGYVVLFAVLAHDFADGMNVVTLALEATGGAKLAGLLLLLDAVAPVIGVGLSFLISIPPTTLALLLAWFAGVFLAVGAGHLLPEAQHGEPGRGPTLVALSAAGAGLVLLVRALTL
jgi:ZIP family zinc transporter